MLHVGTFPALDSATWLRCKSIAGRISVKPDTGRAWLDSSGPSSHRRALDNQLPGGSLWNACVVPCVVPTHAFLHADTPKCHTVLWQLEKAPGGMGINMYGPCCALGCPGVEGVRTEVARCVFECDEGAGTYFAVSLRNPGRRRKARAHLTSQGAPPPAPPE